MREAQQNKLPYLTKQQIIVEVQNIIPLKNPTTQIGQALWHLTKYTKLRDPKVAYIGKNGWVLYTPNDSSERIFYYLKEYSKQLSKRIGIEKNASTTNQKRTNLL